ncbi:hypothetical protein FEM48_Zijuj05G0136200 [Ziziphus jujuba var. spinosa]|uniref:Reverse transcriptase/retrotransposon-derived protein RNase H-like domain-containing protein n=1 Tax=Ziziphus jujuba var. spinosa TaxID=714518 RepID=A0A978VF53_ZIZJJ|nr:hypothetical protein FEM48_Zijuj05G0136200 [Ziziphus jujuba var. spinosa]
MHDHHIPLQPNSAPVNVRPYRYPHYQKAKIERMVKDLLQFGVTTVNYLGHLISEHGMAVDPSKIEAIQAWPVPTTTRVVHGFLGLAGYCRKYIHDFEGIAAPLTRLLTKDGFNWTSEATESFSKLKEALTSPPVLGLPDFSQPFVIECDASGRGLGAVLT